MPASGSIHGLQRVALYTAAVLSGALVAHLHGPLERPVQAAAPDHEVQPAPPFSAQPAVEATSEVETLEPIPRAPEPAPTLGGGRIIEGWTPHRLIYFTFDDGPDRRTTPLLLDRLDAVGVKAAFFLTASRILGRDAREREQAELAREIVSRGHALGNHTVDHLQLPLLGDAAATDQVARAEEIFERVLGFHPLLIRPPGGARSPRIDDLLAKRGYTTVLWNLGAGDFQVKSASEVLKLFRATLDRREQRGKHRGGVVLLHDTYAWSVDAFQLIWAELWERNCRLLARGEELYDVVPDLSFFYQPRADDSASALAAPANPPAQVLSERQAALRAEAKQRCGAAESF
jgi:peptidoglycan/xylan/chitin deacetylase (PgdA/CDA1 family)